MSKGTRSSRSSQDKLLCSVVTDEWFEVLLKCFGGIDVKSNRIFFKSEIISFFIALEVPVESFSKPMN